MSAKRDFSDLENSEGYKVQINGTSYEVLFDESGKKAQMSGRNIDIDIQLERKPDLYSVLIDGKSLTLTIEANGAPGKYRVQAGGYEFESEVITSREARLRAFIHDSNAGAKKTKVISPMPGLIVKALASPGDKITRSQGILIMEAMKMENEIKSPADGILKKLHVTAGDAVEKGQILFELE